MIQACVQRSLAHKINGYDSNNGIHLNYRGKGHGGQQLSITNCLISLLRCSLRFPWRSCVSGMIWSLVADFQSRPLEKALLVLNRSVLGLGNWRWLFLELERGAVYKPDMYAGALLLRALYLYTPFLRQADCVVQIIPIFFNFWSVELFVLLLLFFVLFSGTISLPAL